MPLPLDILLMKKALSLILLLTIFLSDVQDFLVIRHLWRFSLQQKNLPG